MHRSTFQRRFIIFCWFCICCPSLTGHNAINISKIPLVFSVFEEITLTVNVNLYHVTRALHVTNVFLKLDCRSLFTTSTKKLVVPRQLHYDKNKFAQFLSAYCELESDTILNLFIISYNFLIKSFHFLHRLRLTSHHEIGRKDVFSPPTYAIHIPGLTPRRITNL